MAHMGKPLRNLSIRCSDGDAYDAYDGKFMRTKWVASLIGDESLGKIRQKKQKESK